jgi:hypothetical protein
VPPKKKSSEIRRARSLITWRDVFYIDNAEIPFEAHALDPKRLHLYSLRDVHFKQIGKPLIKQDDFMPHFEPLCL